MSRIILTGEMLDDSVQARVLGRSVVKQPYLLEGYAEDWFYGKAFLKKKEGSQVEGILVDVEEEQLWRLDQWKVIPALQRMELCLEDGGRAFLYMSHFEEPKQKENIHLEEQLQVFEDKLKLGGGKKCDLFLLYPCAAADYETGTDEKFVHDFLEGNLTTREKYLSEEEDEEELCQFFLGKLKQYNNEEFEGKFFRKIARTPLGIVKTVVELEGKAYWQYGFSYVSIHPQTAVGMVGLVFPSISVPPELQVCGFCGNNLKIYNQDGKLISIYAWMKERELTPYGSPKAAVFSYSALEHRDILNFLACEMEPMGELVGQVMEAWSRDNFAQYDVAEVYASDRCLLEISKLGCQKLKERLNVEAVELFFMELLMMQEAAIARVSDRTYEIFNEGSFHETGTAIQAKLYDLSREAANAVLFVNYKKLRFPTVRISAKQIAERFGIADELENYKTCRELLEQMIAINTAEEEKIDSSLMNLLLLFLTMIQVLPLLADLSRYLMTGEFYMEDILPTIWGALGCVTLYLIYWLAFKRAARKNRSQRGVL